VLGEEAFEGRPNKMCEVDNGVMVHRSLVVYRKKEASREPPHIVGERYFEHARLRLRFLWHTSLLYHVKNCTKYRQNSIEEKIHCVIPITSLASQFVRTYIRITRTARRHIQ
jgi:hypothetical protein